ncbi:cell division protein FtsL, partial [bacterium]|nr:cell division protein FtsL [bacterium]
NQAIKVAKQRKEELSREIESFQDPLWLQEVVKEELGLVRQKETKIVFRS